MVNIKHNTDAIFEKEFIIKIPKYKCTNCNNYSYEKNHFSLSGYNYSIETIIASLNSFLDISSTFSTVAKQFHMNKNEFIHIFDTCVSDPSKPIFPKVISFDEKFLNRHIAENGYSFVIVDWLKIKIIDIVSSRHIDKLSSYFSKIKPEIRSKVQYITMDMYETYLRIAQVYFNNAIIAIDSFHVLENLTRAFDKVRNKYLRKFDNGATELEDNSDSYYLLKKGKNLFNKIYSNLSQDMNYNKKLKMHISDRTFVDYALKIDIEFEKAYWLLQDYLSFNYHNNPKTAEKEIEEIIDNFLNSNISSYIEFAHTLINWKQYIINSFITIYDPIRKKYRRLSDGPIEGLNNSIDKIHNNGNGFKNFHRFKKVVYYKINKYLKYKIN